MGRFGSRVEFSSAREEGRWRGSRRAGGVEFAVGVFVEDEVVEVVSCDGDFFFFLLVVFEVGFGVEMSGEEALEGGVVDGDGGADGGFGFFVSGVVVGIEWRGKRSAGRGRGLVLLG